MIGKSTRQNVPELAKRATQPLGNVNFDLIISTVTSVPQLISVCFVEFSPFHVFLLQEVEFCVSVSVSLAFILEPTLF
jgi:hypothetical protein